MAFTCSLDILNKFQLHIGMFTASGSNQQGRINVVHVVIQGAGVMLSPVARADTRLLCVVPLIDRSVQLSARTSFGIFKFNVVECIFVNCKNDAVIGITFELM